MCGICGVFHFDSQRPVAEATLRRMASLIAHRGPDGEGVALLGQTGLAHRRLAIIDLSTGDQPMYNEDRALCLVFNGEIYNFKTLREELQAKGHVFTTRSDTEVILHLYEEMGERCVDKLRGMFAFALWDSRNRRLFLARDRAGKKPLYYCVFNGAFYFASEMKALLSVEGIPRSLRAKSVDDFLTHMYVPPPHTILDGIYKLPHAHLMMVKGPEPRIEQYWEIEYGPKMDISEEEALEHCEALIDESVKLRLESDVPLGCFLSGGIDSSLIVAMMRRHITGPLRTFSIGFEHEEYNELPFARQIAERYETEHEEFVVKADAVSALPKLVWHFDEPFADPAALPTLYLSEMTRRHVTVALNGDGGDESFAGYDRYLGGWFKGFDQWCMIPASLRRHMIKPALKGAAHLAQGSWRLSQLCYVNDVSLGDPAYRYVQRLAVIRDYIKARLYTHEFSKSVGPESSLERMLGCYRSDKLTDPLDRMLFTDIMTYLPGALLPKVDRTTMAVGLEGRSPFLDQELMCYTARIPSAYKTRSGETKHLLRRLAAALLPDDLVSRRKQGFVMPLGFWLQGELREVGRELLLGERAINRGFFRREEVEKLYRYEQGAKSKHGMRPWALINLEVWCRTFLDGKNFAQGPITL